jgi:hypothetical protein
MAQNGQWTLEQIPCSQDQHVNLSYGSGNASGKIVSAVGEQITGQVAKFLICHGSPIYNSNIGGKVYWEQGVSSDLYTTQPIYLGLGYSTYTYKKSGVYTVTAKMGALCYRAEIPHGNQEASCGSATATIYESIPPEKLVLTCGNTTPCISVRGGTKLAGTVTLTQPSQDIGTLVRLFGSNGATVASYIVIDKKLSTASFDIQTPVVGSPSVVTIQASSGNIPVFADLALTP